MEGKTMKRRRSLIFALALLLLYLVHGIKRPLDAPSPRKTSLPMPTDSISKIPHGGGSESPDSVQLSQRFDRDLFEDLPEDRNGAPIQKTIGFITTEISGFANHGDPGQVHCNDIRHNATLAYALDHTLEDDLGAANASFADHPLVRKHGPGGWTRLLGSSVWLPEHNVYLLVSRLSYKPEPYFSVLRGQVFDRDWNELQNHAITMEGQTTIFPTNFDLDLDYELDGHWYGPEDPRVILEDGVKGAEPVIVFNQASLATNWDRAMWMYKPITKTLTLFTIRGMKRPETEKNWAPFYYRSPDEIQQDRQRRQQKPSNYIYFIYEIDPMHVLKCHLPTGLCRFVYWADVPARLGGSHRIDEGSSMRGGTQFYPVPLPTIPGTQIYVSVPRTHIEVGCGSAVYRPELVVLAVANGTFHWLYASEPLDLLGVDQPFVIAEKILESALVESKSMDEGRRQNIQKTIMGEDDLGGEDFKFPAVWNPCNENRIFMFNSIASWEVQRISGKMTDTMTLIYSVQDQTIQTARLQGVLALIKSIPGLDEWLDRDTRFGGNALWNLRYDVLGRDVIQCSVEAAGNYSASLKAIFDRNEELLTNFTRSYPKSEVARQHQRVKLLLAAREREKKEQEAQAKAEQEEEELRVKEERYKQLRELEMARIEAAELKGGLDPEEQSRRQSDLDESYALEEELIAKKERFRKLFEKQLARLEREERLREAKERKSKAEKASGKSLGANELINDEQVENEQTSDPMQEQVSSGYKGKQRHKPEKGAGSDFSEKLRDSGEGVDVYLESDHA